MKRTRMIHLSKKYDFFLFDQWGVLHDGEKIFKFTNNTLKSIKNKKLILISNTSQTVSEFKNQTLKKINLKFNYFKNIVTAGETLINIVFKRKNVFSRIILKKKAFIISNKNEKQIIKKLQIIDSNYKECKFILSLSLNPSKNLTSLINKLKFLSKKKVPMICTNPDTYTFKKNTRYFQIGYLAQKYSSFGGKVYFVGKPYKEIFNNAIKKNKKKNALMIGDNLNTDILGGKKFGISTALVLDGYKKLNKIKSDNLAFKKISSNRIKPDYLIKNIAIT